MSKLTEEIRRLSRKIDNIDQRVEKIEESQTEGGWKISGSPIIASPSFETPKFKVGDRLIPHKPKDENGHLLWTTEMDWYDGKTLTVSHISPVEDLLAVEGHCWYFNPSWCTKVEEPKFKNGDWVRSMITGTVGKVEAFYEAGNHSRYLLSTIDGKKFTSQTSQLEPYFPKEGEYVFANVRCSLYETEFIYIHSHLGDNGKNIYQKAVLFLDTQNCFVNDRLLVYFSDIINIRPATAEEKKLLDSKLAEKRLKFDGKEIVKDNTPKVGDFCIFWDNPGFCVCDTLKCIDNDGRFIRDSYGYINCVKFESEEQYRRIKEGKK